MSRDMEKRRAYDRVRNHRMLAEAVSGGVICVQCRRRPREIGAMCLRCRKNRRRWRRNQYLKARPGAGRQHCRLCGVENHNSRTCPTRDMSYEPISIREFAERRLEG